MTRCLLTIILAIITTSNALSQCFDIDSIMTSLATRPIDPIEGVWQFMPDEATIVIEATSSGHFKLTVVDSPDVSIIPGTIMGTASLSAKQGTYDALIATKYDGDSYTFSSHHHFTLTLSDENSSLIFNEYSTGTTVNLWRMVPYMFRHSITKKNTRPSGLDGCHRIYPPSTPTSPIYL